MTARHDTRPRHGAEDALSSSLARRFVAALRAVEDDGDVEDMAGLGTEGTRWWSAGVDGSRTGPDGARAFWSAYRRAFGDITSDFTRVTETDARVVLEWTGHGTHLSGRPVRYDGATVLELGEPDGDRRLTEVRLYFDTSAARSVAVVSDEQEQDGDSLDQATAASGRSSGLAPGNDDAAQ